MSALSATRSGTAWAVLSSVAAGRPPIRPLRWVVLGAHPDDETIAAGALMARCPPCAVVLLTDGAPRDLAWAPAARRAGLDHVAYARARRRELAAALALAMPPTMSAVPAGFLGGVDQEVAHELPRLAHALADRLADLAPDLVLTHPYEGGHPDHDAAAFLARAAAALLARRGAPAPELAEMACYHAEDGLLATGRFLGGAAAEQAVLTLTAERARKRRMMACFATQEEVLRPFLSAAAERFRPVPPCRFDRPPHAGPLLYELWGFPLDGARFCTLAARATAELGLCEVLAA